MWKLLILNKLEMTKKPNVNGTIALSHRCLKQLQFFVIILFELFGHKGKDEDADSGSVCTKDLRSIHHFFHRKAPRHFDESSTRFWPLRLPTVMHQFVLNEKKEESIIQKQIFITLSFFRYISMHNAISVFIQICP